MSPGPTGEPPGAVPAPPRPPATARRPHGLSLAVLLVGLVITGLLTAGARVSYVHSEQRLTALQTELTASALAVAPVDLERRLGQAVSAAAEAADPVAVFHRIIAPSMAPKGPLVVASLFEMRGAVPHQLTLLGGRPLLRPDSAQAAAVIVRAAKSDELQTQWLHVAHAQRFAYELSARGSRGVFVVGAGQALPADRRTRLPKSSPDAGLSIAIYYGATADPADLIATTAAHLPLGGPVSTAHVAFGSSTLTLVASPNGPLAGRFPALVPWGILLVGLLFSAGIAAMTERLVRRREFAEALAGENRRLYHEQRHVAVTLQHSLLPQDLPVAEGIELAVRYVPGTSGIDVGGDWYDVVEVAPRQLFVTVGDVVGRGLGAASLMARLRNAVNTLALDGADPAAALGKVSSHLDASRDGRFATVLCGRLDLDSGELVLASAGHPPPLLVRQGGSEYVGVVAGPPIGLGTQAYPPTRLRLQAGDTLLWFTDGLVERRAESLDEGLERLRAASGAPGSAHDLLDAVLAAMVGSDASDDVAVLALRLTAAPRHPAGPDAPPPPGPRRDEQLRRAVLLARPTAELSRVLDPAELERSVARIGSELFGCCCVLNLLNDDGALRRVAACSSDPTLQAALDELVHLSRLSGRRRREESIAVQVVRSGEAAMGRFVLSDLLAAAPTPDHVRVMSTLDLSAYLVVPLQVGTRRLGVLSWLGSGPGAQDFSPGDRVTAEQFAERAAIALTNARDYDEQRRAVLTLQQAMLQPVPATVPGVAVAARYRAAGSGAGVGGDWYDVFPLRDGTLGVVVGDVEGHDLSAAAAMSQVRSVVHSHARAGLPPALVAEHANRFVCEQQPGRLVTMTYLQLYPLERLIIWARAGNLPVVSLAGDVAEVHARGGGLPLGVQAGARWPEHTTRLPAGALAAVFTNGIVPSDAGIDEATARLIATLARPHAGDDLEALADELAAVAPGVRGRGDDVALVLLRLGDAEETPGGRVTRQLPPIAASAGIARHFLADLLPQWGVGEDTTSIAALLVSELVTNATRHTDEAIELRVGLGERLRVEVYDDSHRLPELRHAALQDTAGRGLELVEMLSAGWGVEHERTGKAVWFELALAAVPLPT